MAWRKPLDGLKFNHTVKGCHKGSGGRVAHFMVAIAYGRGVILRNSTTVTWTGKSLQISEGENFFYKTVIHHRIAAKPSQRCKKYTLESLAFLPGVPTWTLRVLQRKEKTSGKTLSSKISRGNFIQFSGRVKRTLENYPADIIDRTIDSMDKRISMIILC